ncbi:DNA damage-induced apoptosis suppressor protein isoform X2 [Hemicordylus capensis]|uniref:DNA damage-induced apoptosis suppressor protein isoform X2 n=1 Tax=Hemicordylus capensis TaxID=884348 RepID=UPI002304CE5F|nr:DNA damage-induced apoptosis suppressor protein isoform X2 [Hemicordylus capensis]
MNGRRRLLAASVISIQNFNFVYPSCQNCFSRLFLDSERYIEEADQEPDRDASPDVLVKAVETCFIGKKFVFGVKDSSKQDGASFLQNHYQTDPKALTACQMFVPNSSLVGHTVIHYLQQQQRSHFKHHPRDSKPSSDLFRALDPPSILLSSLHSSGGLGALPSRRLDSLSNLWPQSFGLTSSSISGGTTADPIALSSSKSPCEEQKQGNRPVSVHSQPIPSPQDSHLTVNNRNLPHLSSAWCGITVKSEPKSHSSLARKSYRSLESLLGLGGSSSSGEISIQQSCGPENAWNPLLCQSGNSPEDPWFGDELPSSESLNEFIARIENKATVLPTEAKAWERSPSKGTDDCYGHFKQSSPKPGVCDAHFLTEHPDEKLQELAEKVDVWKEDDLPCHECNLSSLQGKESQQETFGSNLSTERTDELNCLPNEHHVLFPWSSPAAVKAHSKGTCLSTKKGADQDVRNLKYLHPSSSSKSTSNCQESLSLQTRKKTTLLNCKRDNCLANWGNQGSSSSQLNQTADPTNIQVQGFASAACEESDAVCARERESVPEVRENNGIDRNVSGLLQGCSDCPQDSYNASADLFDASAGGPETAVGMLNAAQVFSVQESAWTERPVLSELLPSELDAGQNTSQRGLTLCNLHATSDQKLSTLVAGSASDSEPNLAITLDFVPYSQSTPLVKPRQQVRLPRARESILSVSTLNTLSRIDAKCKRPRPALKTPLVKQLVGKSLQSRRLSHVDSSSIGAAGPQQLCISDSPARKLSENYSEEWIPPSERKWVRPLASRNQKIFGLRTKRSLLRNFADYQITEQSPLSENRVSCGIRVKRAELTPKKEPSTQAPMGTVPIHEDAANLWQETDASPDFGAFAVVNKLNFSSTPRWSNAGSWSPELFVGNSQLPSLEAVFSDPST